MGVVHSTRLSTASEAPNSKLKPMRERDRYGVCIVKVASVMNTTRRNSDRQNTHTVTPRGAIVHGTQCNPQVIQRGILYV
jgi:hypothetical protein